MDLLPNSIGPGIWFDLHLEAFEATTEEKKVAFATTVERLRTKFPCVTCRIHLQDFCEKEPLAKYWNRKSSISNTTQAGRDTSLFEWTWILHNKVNERLRKVQPSFASVYAYYASLSSTVCTTCGNDDKLGVTPASKVILQPILTKTAPQIPIIKTEWTPNKILRRSELKTEVPSFSPQSRFRILTPLRR